MEKIWNVWGALLARPHIEFERAPLPDRLGGGMYWPEPEGWASIVIDPRLSRQEAKARLAHELIHDERGGGVESEGMPPSWEAVKRRLHIAVDDEAVVRLVPLGMLEEFCRRHVDVAGTVTVHDVAEEFDCAEWVAKRALELLIERLAA